jgi:hypothetical protein
LANKNFLVIVSGQVVPPNTTTQCFMSFKGTTLAASNSNSLNVEGEGASASQGMIAQFGATFYVNDSGATVGSGDTFNLQYASSVASANCVYNNLQLTVIPVN